MPSASQRVLTTAMVWGWHWASAKNVMALFFLPFFESATHMLMASAAAVASSRSEALACVTHQSDEGVGGQCFDFEPFRGPEGPGGAAAGGNGVAATA